MAHGNNTIPIPGELRSGATEGVVASADAIKDYKKGKFQEQVNEEVGTEIDNIKGGATDSIASLKTAIDNEKSRAQNAESTLQNNINAEKARAEGVEAIKANASDVYTKAEGTAFEGSVNSTLNQKTAAIETEQVSQRQLITTEFANQDSKMDNMQATINAKQLEIGAVQTDDEPTKDSGNHLTSGTIYNSLLQGGIYKDNSEYLQVTMDNDDKILEGIKLDGTKQIGADLNIEGSTTIIGDTNMLGQANLPGVTYTNVENPEYISVESDNEGRMLQSRDYKGFKREYVGFKTPNISIDGATAEIIEDPEKRIEIKTDSGNNILSYRGSDGVIHENVGIQSPKVTTDELALSHGGLNKLEQALIDDGFNPGESTNNINQNNIEIAIGKVMSYGTEQSEKEAMPIVDDVANQYVGYKTVTKNHYPKRYDKIVILNHDDLPKSDYIANRRIHNKYETLASFCSIFKPFVSLSEAKEKIVNIKKLILDGHEIGLHAMIGFSYWREQRMFDVRPDGSNTFAPNRTEMLGNNPDGTGINTFGTEITGDTTMADLYSGLDGAFYGTRFTSIKAVDMTAANVNDATRQFTIYSDEETRSGIDDTIIEDIMTAEGAITVRLTSLQWIEKYYNTFIDNTLGYSKYNGTIAERFAEDYSVPSGASLMDYYPDGDHLLNGKMVYWNDTDNPHYAEALVKTDGNFTSNSYQLVGKFVKGLYKGSFSTCNYEVIDRCTEVAQAFYRKYYGLSHFTDAHTHGVKYLSGLYWKDADGIPYLDRNCKELVCNGSFYVSRVGSFMTETQLFKGFGFANLSVSLRRHYVDWEGLTGFYYGQSDIRNPEINSVGSQGIFEHVNYLTLFGTSDTGMDTMSYATFMNFIDGIDNITKFFYENQSGNVTRNGDTKKVYAYLFQAIRCITSTIGTGKVPVISVDTIGNDAPAQNMAVDILCRFCKSMGFDMLPYEAGYEYINSKQRNTSGNLFPNPDFRQSLLNYFGGSSSLNTAYLPDGWYRHNGNAVYDCSNRAFRITGSVSIKTRIYGLPSGKYELSYTVSTEGPSSANMVIVKLVKNKDKFDSSNAYHTTYALQAQEVNERVDIVIPEPYRRLDEESPISMMLDGYQDNVACIEIEVSTSSDITMKNVCLYKV